MVSLFMEYTYSDANLLTEEKSKFTLHQAQLTTIRTFYHHLNFILTLHSYSSHCSEVEASMNRKEWVNPDNTAKSLTQNL